MRTSVVVLDGVLGLWALYPRLFLQVSNKGELSDYFSFEASILYYSQRAQTSQKGARGKQIDQNDNVVEIGRLNAIVADLNKKNRQLTTENNKLKKTVATKEGLKENNRQLTEENKKLKKTAATNEAVLEKEKAEKEKFKVHVSTFWQNHTNW